MLQGETAHCVTPGWRQTHLLGPMSLRANVTFELSRVDAFSGLMRGILEVVRTLGVASAFVKLFLQGGFEVTGPEADGLAKHGAR